MLEEDPWADAKSVAAPLTVCAQADAGTVPTSGPRYEQRSTVAKGGMGQVDVVRDRWLDRDVARKVVTGDGREDRLAREAAITARLDHPGIVPIFDTGVDDQGRRFYTMPLVRGHALSGARGDRIRHLLAAANAVAHAHNIGVVHRDVKPDNVLVGRHGEVQVVDWGIALDHGGAGLPEGTPGWSDPDQLAGATVDKTHDVYALGRCLRSVLDDAPADLVAIADRAEARGYPDAEAFADDLAAWLDGRRVSAHQYSTTELLLRTARAFRGPLAVGTVALVALVTLGAVTLRQTRAERDRALVAEREANEHLAVLLSAQAVAAFEKGHVAEAEHLAARAIASGDLPASRGVLAALDANPPLLIETSPLPCDDPELLGDGRIACFEEGGVRLFGGDASVFLDHPGAIDVQLGPTGVLTGSRVRTPLGERELWTWHQAARQVQLDAPTGPLSHGAAPLLVHHITESRSFGPDGDVIFEWDPCPVDIPRGSPLVQADGTALWSCRKLFSVGRPPAIDRTVATGRDLAALDFWGDRVVVSWYDGMLGVYDGDVLLSEHAISGGTPSALAVEEDWAIVSPERGPIVAMALDHRAWHHPLPMADGPAFAVVDDELVTVGERVATWALPPPGRAHRYEVGGGVTSIAWTADGAVAVGAGGSLERIGAHGDRAVAPAEGCQPVKDVVWSGDAVFAACAAERGLTVWHADGRVERRGQNLSGPRIGRWPDGQVRWVTYGVSLYNVDGTFVELSSTVGDFVPTDDGMWVVLSTGAVGWMSLEGELERTLDRTARRVDTSPDGASLLLALGESLVRITTQDKTEWVLGVDRPITAIDWSPRGDLVAIGLMDGTAQLHDAAVGTLVAIFPGHAERVAAVAFSPDGAQLATGSWDRSVRFWDVDRALAPPDLARVEATYGW